MVQDQGGYTRLGRGSTINHIMETPITIPGKFSPCPLNCNGSTRIVNRKNGRPNLHRVNITSKWFTFLTDNFTTLVNSPWYVLGLIFTGTYLISWIIFGGIWAVVADLDGDFNSTCLRGVDDFSSALLFSIETQVTIGYGNTYVTNDCTVGLFVLILQCVVGLVIDAVLLGLLFTKITRPRNRRKTILFSERAVIYEDNDEQYLEFRIGNLRKSQMAECHVRLVLYWYRENSDGDYVFEQHDLQCGYETGTDRVVLLTPAIVQHKIDANSPLSGLSPQCIIQEDLEVVAVLEGIVEATGLTLQALWSYTSDEIVVGRKLQSIVSRQGGRWIVDFGRFNEILL